MLKEDEQYQYLRRDQAAAQRLNTRMYCTQWEAEHCQRFEQLAQELRELGKAQELMGKQASDDEQEKTRLAELDQALEVSRSAFTQGLTEINTSLTALQGNLEYLLHLDRDVIDDNRMRRQLKELGHGAVALHYLLINDAVKIILTTPDKQVDGKTEIKLSKLRRKVGSIRQAILRKHEQKPQQSTAEILALSQELYQDLIAPVAAELDEAHAQTLMVSLDGILRYLPFSVLHDGDKYLIERYAISMQTLAARTDLKDKPKENWRISGFGVSQAAEVMEPGASRPTQFDALLKVPDELEALFI